MTKARPPPLTGPDSSNFCTYLLSDYTDYSFLKRVSRLPDNSDCFSIIVNEKNI